MDGISLQPPPIHRANKRPLVIVITAIVVVAALLVWAWVVKSNNRMQVLRASTAKPTSADSALKSLDKQWGGGRSTPGAQGVIPGAQPPIQPPIEAHPVEPPPMMPPRARMAGGHAADMDASIGPLAALGTPTGTRKTPEDERAAEELAAMDSPLSPTQATNGSPVALPPGLPGSGRREQSAPEEENESQRQNMNASKKAFAGEGGAVPIIAESGKQYGRVIRAGWDIPAILEQSANSDLPGDLRARVRENVYDTDTGKYLLIPQNSILVGKYNSDVSYGQARMQCSWDRLQRPGEPTIFLGTMNGLANNGSAGVTGNVNNHMKRLIGFALLSSAFAAGIQVSQERNNSAYGYPTNGQVAGAAVGQQMGEFGRRVTDKNLNRPPTLEVKAGTRFNVRVNRDIILP